MNNVYSPYRYQDSRKRGRLRLVHHMPSSGFDNFIEPWCLDASLTYELIQRQPPHHNKQFFLNMEHDTLYLKWLGITGTGATTIMNRMLEINDVLSSFIDPTAQAHSYFTEFTGRLAEMYQGQMMNEMYAEEVAMLYYYVNKFSPTGFGDRFSMETGWNNFNRNKIKDLPRQAQILNDCYLSNEKWYDMTDLGLDKSFFFIDPPSGVDLVQLREWCEALTSDVMIILPASRTVKEIFSHRNAQYWDLKFSKKFDIINEVPKMVMLTNYDEMRCGVISPGGKIRYETRPI